MKTSKIILVVLSLCLITPLISAITIQDFLADMKAHPNNYYIMHNRTELNMVSRIEDFADNFGVSISDTFIPKKNFIVLSVIDSDFGFEYVYGSATSYVGMNDVDMKPENYVEIYLTIEDGYNKYLLSLDPAEVLDKLDLDNSGYVSKYEAIYDYLDVFLDYLLTYQTWPTDKHMIKAVNGQIIEKRRPTCEEFIDYDHNIWVKDKYLFQGDVFEDFCSGNILSELTCIDNYVNYKSWTCDRGCSGGRCISSIFFLINQYDQRDISYNNFNSALNVWLDV